VCIALVMAILLRFNGRIWWCKFGDWAIYVNEAWNSSHTSQHFFDPYTFTHVLHGVLGFWLAGLLLKNYSKTVWFVVTLAVEAAWEILENSNFIIEKYRENTASLDYFGDSIANSIGDLMACAAGFLIAMKLGVWRSLVFFVVVELLLLVWIRDGFLLNILMLVYPLESIKAWQMGA
jgi:Protein of unknown function (DUF2585)